MKLIWYEIRKIAGIRYVWILIAFLLGINSLLVYSRAAPFDRDGIDCSIAVETYPTVVQSMIDAACVNLEEYTVMGLQKDSYAWQYQETIIEHYTQVLEQVRFTGTNVRGWHLVLADHTVHIFVFLSVLIMSSVLYTHEQASGFLTVMRTCSKGRRYTVLAKTAACIGITWVLVLLFSVENLLIYGIGQGYSEPGNALLILEAYRACPWVLTIGEYYLISLGMRLLAGTVYALLCTMLSVFLYNYVFLFVSGLGILGLNFVLYSMRVYTPDSLLKHMNLITVSVCDPLYTRYRTVNLFGQVTGFIPLLMILYGILLLTAVVITLYRFEKPVYTARWVWLETKWKSVLEKCRNRKGRRNTVKRYSTSIFAAELYKTLTVSHVWILLLLFVFLKGTVSVVVYRPDMTFSEAVYRGYMTELAGEISEEKKQWIAGEREFITGILDRSREMDSAYRNLEISKGEYIAYMQEYEYAVSREELFGRIEEQAAYIEEMAAEGREAWFVYDTGWLQYFGAGFDWTLYGAVLVLSAAVFPAEWDRRSSADGFAVILRTTRYGRGKTYIGKWFSVWLLGLMLGSLWNGIDLFIISKFWPIPLPEAPLLSIRMFSEMRTDLSMGEYTAVLSVWRTAAASSLAILSMLITAQMKKRLPGLACIVLFTLFPKILSLLGTDALIAVDSTRYLQGTPLFRENCAVLYACIVWILIVAGTGFTIRNWYGRKGR